MDKLWEGMTEMKYSIFELEIMTEIISFIVFIV